MSSRNHNNKKEVFKELEKTISPVLVINNPSLKPYVEVFEYYPENIYQQPLGSLIGFFEIKDYSKDSAYIVNFLTLTLKKEYYNNPKRSVAESLDSALHKVNLALSEIANKGNIEWLGKLDAAIFVLEKNNAHFSVSGKAKIFLYRNTVLTDLSEGLASDFPEPHPLKTFINVSSGRLEKFDQILITSEDIFHILSVTELRKNFQRFKGEKFVQLLKTALSNQLELIATLVVQISDTNLTNEIKNFSSRKKISPIGNVFSEKTFIKSQNQSEINESQFNEGSNKEKAEDEYTDKKTGHIYVQGEDDESDENKRINLYWDMTKEKIAQGWYSAKNDIKRRFSLYKKQLAKKRQLLRIEKEKKLQVLKEKIKKEQAEKAMNDVRLELEVKENEEMISRNEKEAATPDNAPKIEEIVKIEEITISGKPQELTFKEKLEIAVEQERKITIEENNKPTNVVENEEKESRIAIFVSALKKIANKIINVLGKISAYVRNLAIKAYEKIKQINVSDAKKVYGFIPHFSKIKRLFSSFSYSQKIYTLLALIIIFIGPIFIVKWMNRTKIPTINELENAQPTLSEILSSEKNINLSTQKQIILSRNDLINAMVTNNGIAGITKNSVIIINNGEQKEYTLPENSGVSSKATFMKDLSLIFIVTDKNKIVSFSPVSSKFISENINLSENISSYFIGTYLTYIYMLDPQTNQIYRYPRVTGGFGNKTSWLKEDLSLSGISDMTIDENIYCVQNNSVLKLFKGKKQDFSLENSNTPVNFDKIFTNINSSSLYALDAKKSRIIQYNKTDGTIIKQYFNESLANGTSLSVDEINKLAYITTSSELISISIQ
ncbi:MAG TPA: hypothetical protein P5548_02125 [Candidatus Moranbacteria bacterium]|nr:hypothetical protein [Candidatus Moranbacteria bacterium]HRZ33670.1 hypothetical protein [Candidatus Moranbacteria bacterium]